MILIYKCGQPGEKYQFIIKVWKLKKKKNSQQRNEIEEMLYLKSHLLSITLRLK